VGDHLLQVLGRRPAAAGRFRCWLDVQAGQLDAEHDSRLSASDDEVVGRGKAGHRRVTTHVAEVQPLGCIRHTEVARQEYVQPLRRVAGAGHDGEQADVLHRHAALGEGRGDGLSAQRHYLLQEPLHPAPVLHDEMSSWAGLTTPKRVVIAECSQTLRRAARRRSGRGSSRSTVPSGPSRAAASIQSR
jgi:hypothetical protein